MVSRFIAGSIPIYIWGANFFPSYFLLLASFMLLHNNIIVDLIVIVFGMCLQAW